MPPLVTEMTEKMTDARAQVCVSLILDPAHFSVSSVGKETS